MILRIIQILIILSTEFQLSCSLSNESLNFSIIWSIFGFVEMPFRWYRSYPKISQNYLIRSFLASYKFERDSRLVSVIRSFYHLEFLHISR